MGNAYTVLIGKSRGKRPLGKPKRKWTVNTNMDVKGITCEGFDCMQLARNRVQRGQYSDSHPITHSLISEEFCIKQQRVWSVVEWATDLLRQLVLLPTSRTAETGL